MKTGNTISRTSSNSIYKIINGRPVWFHQDSIHNIEVPSKYGKKTLYYVMKQIIDGKRKLPIPFEYQDRDFVIHFTVKEDKTIVFDYDLVPKEFRMPQPQGEHKYIRAISSIIRNISNNYISQIHYLGSPSFSVLAAGTTFEKCEENAQVTIDALNTLEQNKKKLELHNELVDALMEVKSHIESKLIDIGGAPYLETNIEKLLKKAQEVSK